eukprot:11222895-Lingulodinium_polyedra.AAC.1
MGPGGRSGREVSCNAMRAAQASATTELPPPGMRMTREAIRSQRSRRRAHAIAAPAATLCPCT